MAPWIRRITILVAVSAALASLPAATAAQEAALRFMRTSSPLFS